MIVFLSTADTDILTLHHTLTRLPEGFWPVRAANPSDLIGLSDLDAHLDDLLSQARLVVMRLLSGKRAFEGGFEKVVAVCQARGIPLIPLPGTQEVDLELFTVSTVGERLLQRTMDYLGHGGGRNFHHMLRFLSDEALGTAYGYELPEALPLEGVYHPDFPDGILLEAYLAERVRPDRPTIGLLFYRAHWLSHNLAFVDALIERIEAGGANVLPVFCYSLKDEGRESEGAPGVFAQYFADAKGRPRTDVILSTLSFAMSRVNEETSVTQAEGWPGDFLARFNVPILQAIISTGPFDAWEEQEMGLSPLDTAISVTMPEFDGRIITVPVSFKEEVRGDQDLGAPLRQYVPRPDRVDFAARLALRWAALRRKQNEEKKIAILLTNYPSKNARIGNAVGLDTPASVVNLLRAMEKSGYEVGEVPDSGDALIEAIIARCSNDREFLTEEQMRGAVGHVSEETYRQWFDPLPARVRKEMREAWGAPPGEVFLLEGSLVIPGILLGNVFVGLQPPRGYGDNPMAIYHSPDLVPAHHYLAYYRWIRDVFRADAVIHVGKHGTLEWLPGKGIGLSEACYPEVVLNDLPHFYPYIVNNPGEGTQAKRRSHATLIDHLIPAMTTAETYDHIARLEQLLDEYYRVQTMDPRKLPILQRQIWEVTAEARLNVDLEVETTPEDFDAFLKDMDGYLCELKDAQIRDGLHTLGQAPENEQLIGLLSAIVRLDNGDVPSLRRAVCEAFGFGLAELSEEQGTLLDRPVSDRLAQALPGREIRVRGETLEAVETFGKGLLVELRCRAFDPEVVPDVVMAAFGEGAPDVEAALRFVAEIVYPALMQTPNEIENTLRGLSGGHVPAGPSGSPTRGMANVLPTGRNFYSVDPRSLPSPAAWEVGCQAGDALLKKYFAEERSYPESVGLVVWGTSAMRTHGDDVAEILYLLGVRPVWQAESRRVRGVEVIPLSELGRPRIDVTARISGFFRDAFPNLVGLIDEAVASVASLDEPEEMNYVRKHTLASASKKEAEGLSGDEAWARSLYRVFGSKPGTYGAGILPVIQSGNWESDQNLADIYITWGSYAYTRTRYGDRAMEEFVDRFREIVVAAKNQDNREHDIFDSDDYLQYHGGMIATIRALMGRSPRQFFGDTSDPSRVRVRDLADEARRVFRTRVVNPKWIDSIMRHGYKGASEMAATVEYLFGYDATARVVDDWMYEQLSDAYVFDEAVRRFLEEKNPWALRDIAGRLLEAMDRGLWENPPEAMRRGLERVLLRAEGDIEARQEGTP